MLKGEKNLWYLNDNVYFVAGKNSATFYTSITEDSYTSAKTQKNYYAKFPAMNLSR